MSSYSNNKVKSRMNADEHLTICITHFKRPDSLKNCLQSLDTHYPNVRRVIQDTEGNLSRGRNIAISKVETPLLMICEEDYVFDSDYDLNKLIEVIESDNEIGGACGNVEDHKEDHEKGCKVYRRNWYANMERFRGSLTYERPTKFRITPGGVTYLVCNLLLNAGVWRKEVFDKCPWDEELEVDEHKEWFWRLSRKEEWKCAYVPSLCLKHFPIMPNEIYRKMRKRQDFKSLNKKKMNVTTTNFFWGFKDIVNERPNIIVLGVGHSNTSITTKQIHRMGWNSCDADEEYSESVTVRELNSRISKEREYPLSEFSKILERFKQPWAIKDPRFSRYILHKWIPSLSKYKPLLVWITKDIKSINKSYEKRGEKLKPGELEGYLKYCEEQFNSWPWGKIKISAHEIGAACSVFGVNKNQSHQERSKIFRAG